MSDTSPHRLVRVDLDERSLAPAPADIEHERKVAIFDLIQENAFRPVGAPDGPYVLRLGIVERRLAFDIRSEDDAPLVAFGLAMSPFRKIIKDYFLLCESYYDAIRNAAPAQIETVDMARRGMHDEGSRILIERLDGKIDVDFDTARRLFTLICALHMR